MYRQALLSIQEEEEEAGRGGVVVEGAKEKREVNVAVKLGLKKMRKQENFFSKLAHLVYIIVAYGLYIHYIQCS